MNKTYKQPQTELVETMPQCIICGSLTFGPDAPEGTTGD